MNAFKNMVKRSYGTSAEWIGRKTHFNQLANHGHNTKYQALDHAGQARYDPQRFLTETNARKGQEGYQALKPHRQTAADNVTDRQWLFENHTKKFMQRYNLHTPIEHPEVATGQVGQVQLGFNSLTNPAEHSLIRQYVGENSITDTPKFDQFATEKEGDEVFSRKEFSNVTTNLPMSQVRPVGEDQHRVFTRLNKGVDVQDAIQNGNMMTTTELSGCSIIREGNSLFHIRPNDVAQGIAGTQTQEWAAAQPNTRVIFGPSGENGYRETANGNGQGTVLFKPKMKNGEQVLRVYKQAQANHGRPTVTTESLT